VLHGSLHDKRTATNVLLGAVHRPRHWPLRWTGRDRCSAMISRPWAAASVDRLVPLESR
jgi:hypothetical protein